MGAAAPTIGVIRVITSDDRDLLDQHGRVLEREFGVRTVTRCLPGQPHGVHDEATFETARASMAEVARGLEAEGVGAIVISCAADPGLPEARAAVSVPVFGAGSSGAAIALALGGKVGVLGITAEVPAAVTAVLGERLVAAEVPDGVARTTELTTPAGREAALVAAERLRAAGAEVILFACTGLTTLALAEPVAEATGLPVVDAVQSAGLLAARFGPPAVRM